MQPVAQPLDRKAVLLMLMLCASWGLNQIAQKVALADIEPITQCALRSIGGSVVVGLYAWRRERGSWRGGDFYVGVAAGLLFTFEFIVLYLAIKYTSVARSILFVYTAPFFVALGALAFFPQERLRAVQWVGLFLAFCGIGVSFLAPDENAGLLGETLAIAAAAAWGLTTVLIKASRLRSAAPTKVLLYQIATSALVSPLAAWAAGEGWPAHISALTALSMIYQIVWVVGVSYAIWFWLIAHYRAGDLSAFTFLTPVIGVLAGHFLLGDAISHAFAVTLGLVIAGIVMVNWPQANPRLAAPGVPPDPE